MAIASTVPLSQPKQSSQPKGANTRYQEISSAYLQDLQKTCYKKQETRNRVFTTVISIISVVGAVFTGLLLASILNPLTGFLFGCVAHFVLDGLLSAVVTGCRTNRYEKAAQTMGAPRFQTFLEEQNFTPTEENVLSLVKLFNDQETLKIKNLKAQLEQGV